ncbi:MAG: porin, partial [Sorangium cellulosum]
GHTDNRGVRAFNVGLSKQRAAAVVKWLVNHGVEANRLVSKGHGPDKPMGSNDTEQGRQSNRRVEFLIIDRESVKR